MYLKKFQYIQFFTMTVVCPWACIVHGYTPIKPSIMC